MRLLIVMTAILAVSCQRQTSKAPQGADAGAPVPSDPGAVAPEGRVGSPAFHLEVGGVYERFHDPKGAAEHFSEAAKAATAPGQRAQAYSALARAREAAGDRSGAISALEQALAEVDKARTESAAGAAVQAPGAELVERLAQLYMQDHKYEAALKLCHDRSALFAEPWAQERLYQLEMAIEGGLGTLDK